MSVVAPRIALIGTLDTKGAEIEYVRKRIRVLGGEPIVIDSGILGDASGSTADVTREQVAAAAGHSLDDIRKAGSRGRAVEMMREGVRAVCVRLHSEGRLQGALCLGGAEGALLGAYAMQALPLGVPKVIVSPSASGRRMFGPFIGSSDVLVMHSVVDILGLNPIAISVFDNAVAAVVGMATHAGRSPAGLGGRSVGVTMLGQTTPGVMQLRDALERAGWETVIFHANGVGGPAMEALARQGALAGVVDYTLSELANSLMDGIHATGPERLTVVGEMGLPQVVVPGCVDFFNQGAPETLPERYRQRRSYYHNPVATLVRLEPDEMAELGSLVAKRLNGARGPVSVVAPTRGFSLSDTHGNALWYPEADAAFLRSLEASLRSGIAFERVDATVNDPAFADVVAERYLTITKEHAHA
ncbi:MAG TPA: Tm-1-like ATP-binding domain-containing protein [Candidatus Dormibacteraeota bacterium]|nr:Tm-1-like ATP-binding domain-containing protein [Candidatus Dormibacteraeota bacterium]